MLLLTTKQLSQTNGYFHPPQPKHTGTSKRRLDKSTREVFFFSFSALIEQKTGTTKEYQKDN